MWNGVHSSCHCDPSQRNVCQISENNFKRCKHFECVSKTAFILLIIFSINYFDDWGDYSASFLFFKMTVKTEHCHASSVSARMAGLKSLFWSELRGTSARIETRNLAINPLKCPTKYRCLGFFGGYILHLYIYVASPVL